LKIFGYPTPSKIVDEVDQKDLSVKQHFRLKAQSSESE
jgi:hypothetical protein